MKAAQDAELPKVQKPEACYCYIVQCSDGTFYTGWTTDPERRLKTHNAGRGARYTRMRRPVKLVYERAIKAMTREKKRELIQNL